MGNRFIFLPGLQYQTVWSSTLFRASSQWCQETSKMPLNHISVSVILNDVNNVKYHAIVINSAIYWRNILVMMCLSICGAIYFGFFWWRHNFTQKDGDQNIVFGSFRYRLVSGASIERKLHVIFLFFLREKMTGFPGNLDFFPALIIFIFFLNTNNSLNFVRSTSSR